MTQRYYGAPARRGGLPSLDSNPGEAYRERREFLSLPHSYDLFDRRAELVMGLVVTRERHGFFRAEGLWIWHASDDHPQSSRASGSRRTHSRSCAAAIASRRAEGVRQPDASRRSAQLRCPVSPLMSKTFGKFRSLHFHESSGRTGAPRSRTGPIGTMPFGLSQG